MPRSQLNITESYKFLSVGENHVALLYRLLYLWAIETTLIFKGATSKESPKFIFNEFRAVPQKIPFKTILAITRFVSTSNTLISLGIRRLSSKENF